MREQGVEAERFAVVVERFAKLGEEMSDTQLLTLADTYHEILRLRRAKRGATARFEQLQAC